MSVVKPWADWSNLAQESMQVVWVPWQGLDVTGVLHFLKVSAFWCELLEGDGAGWLMFVLYLSAFG